MHHPVLPLPRRCSSLRLLLPGRKCKHTEQFDFLCACQRFVDFVRDKLEPSSGCNNRSPSLALVSSRYTDRTMPSEPPTLTRRSFLSAATAGIVSSPIWPKAITARVSDSRLLNDIEHRTFNFYWERVNHSNGLMAD